LTSLVNCIAISGISNNRSIVESRISEVFVSMNQI
jgi:hypothetical protein